MKGMGLALFLALSLTPFLFSTSVWAQSHDSKDRERQPDAVTAPPILSEHRLEITDSLGVVTPWLILSVSDQKDPENGDVGDSTPGSGASRPPSPDPQPPESQSEQKKKACEFALTPTAWAEVDRLREVYLTGGLPSRAELRRASNEARLAALWAALEQSQTHSLLPIDEIVRNARSRKELEAVLSRIADYFGHRRPILGSRADQLSHRHATQLMEDLLSLKIAQAGRSRGLLDGIAPHSVRELRIRVLERAALTDGFAPLARQIGWQRDPRVWDRISIFMKKTGIPQHVGLTASRSFAEGIKRSVFRPATNLILQNPLPPAEASRLARVSQDMSRLIIEKGGVNAAEAWINANPTSKLARELLIIDRYAKVENGWRAARSSYLGWRLSLLIWGGVEFARNLNENITQFRDAFVFLEGLFARQKQREQARDRYLKDHPELMPIYDWAKNQLELRQRAPNPRDPDPEKAAADLEDYQALRALLGLEPLTDEEAANELVLFLKKVDLWER